MRKWLLLAVWGDRTVTLASSHGVEIEAYTAAAVAAATNVGKPVRIDSFLIVPARRLSVVDGRLVE